MFSKFVQSCVWDLIHSTIAEYKWEFQGSIQNLQKRALFVKFYPEMPWNNTEMHQNNTTFGKKVTFCQILQRAAFEYQTLISSGLFLALIAVGVVLMHKMFVAGTKHLSATDGQLKVFLGPYGWRNSIFKPPSWEFQSLAVRGKKLLT